MRRYRISSFVLMVAVCVVLAACEEAGVKAERKYERALSLLEEAEPERAIVELRGVFDFNAEHYEARMLYADLQRDRGNLSEAFGHYALTAEQHPTQLRPRVELATLAVTTGQWDQLDTHVTAAKRISAEDTEVQVLELAIEYRDAVADDDMAAVTGVAERAKELLEVDPTLDVANSVLADAQMRLGDPFAALETVEAALARDPLNEVRQQFKLSLLFSLQDMEGIGAQLREMRQLFPDNPEYTLRLVQWSVSVGDIAGADAILREEIDQNPDEVEPLITHFQFLLEVQGVDAAREELTRRIEENGENRDLFVLMQANLDFSQGNQQAAIQDLRVAITDREPTDMTRDMSIALARMLRATDQAEDEVSQLIATTLEQDPQHVGALKLHSDDLIERDLVGDAIISVRSALDQAPRDPELFTLLAKAHQRDGNRVLMGENLALAVESSGAGVVESLRYAQFLMQDEKYGSARAVVQQALRRDPTNLGLLRTLSQIHVGLADWPAAEQVVRTLRNLSDENANILADSIEATVLRGMARTDESLELLRGMLTEDATALVAQAAIIRTHLANNELGAARRFMDTVLDENPESASAQFLNAALLSVEQDYEQAADIYRALLAEAPTSETIWRAHIANLARGGDVAGSKAAVDEALTHLPESMNLLWVKASYEEQLGNIDAAITIYENLYNRESGSTIIANNLASLLSSHSPSEADLERSYLISRRLRDTRVPAFQDTYGWIAFRLGNIDEAYEYLRPAAQALRNDPLVQEHFAEVLAARQNYAEAKTHYEAALSLVPETETERRAGLTARISRMEQAISAN